jgi:hypothetical protein
MHFKREWISGVIEVFSQGFRLNITRSTAASRYLYY